MWVALVRITFIFKNSLLHADTVDAIPLIHLNGLWSQRGRMQQCALTWHFGWYWQFRGNNLPRNSSHPLRVLWETLLSYFSIPSTVSVGVVVSSFFFTLWPSEQVISNLYPCPHLTPFLFSVSRQLQPSLLPENEQRMKARCHFYLL